MKKYIFLTLALLIVLTSALVVFAESSGNNVAGRNFKERINLLQTFFSIAKNNKAKVTAIEKHLETIRTCQEGLSAIPPYISFQGVEGPGSEEMLNAIAENKEKKAILRKQLEGEIDAIELKLMTLRLPVQILTEHYTAQDELQKIAESAKSENATETAKLIRGLIDKREQAFQEKLKKVGMLPPWLEEQAAAETNTE